MYKLSLCNKQCLWQHLSIVRLLHETIIYIQGRDGADFWWRHQSSTPGCWSSCRPHPASSCHDKQQHLVRAESFFVEILQTGATSPWWLSADVVWQRGSHISLFSPSHIGAGTIFRLGEQKLVKNNQDNQIQSITLCNVYFSEKKVYAIYNAVWAEPPELQKLESSWEFTICKVTLSYRTRNTLECDQCNVYSSGVVFLAISQDLLFVLSLYTVGRLVTLSYEISFESPSL